MSEEESGDSEVTGVNQIADLSELLVIDSLEIGPAKVEERRVRAPYKVRRGRSSESFEFEYKYEEDVFEVDEPDIQNLASMMTAQVGINYGLFCREIRFHGQFDQVDQRFIRDMAENTAREIYVLKLLKPNPFIKNEMTGLPPIRKSGYLQAEIVFPDGISRSNKREQGCRTWAGLKSRHSVLSSGGKDSLLSYAILKEIGVEVHPIFVNESGRHWFTALNAYRHLKGSDTKTGRVWTNSDRLFSWMLHHLPFVRSDFARVRSDQYPVRLWTVAVFLFGVLPYLRKRGIGRLLIGDEYDTTVRQFYKGTTHYSGLYDQSRYFDNAMTRYFNRKGWGISQFSLLRQLSELLIQKTLASRYPDLQRHQLSCHAAHTHGDRVFPCGRCEKCRRIVAMLSAVGADPRNCGYKEKHLAGCLDALIKKGIHQESYGAEHLMWLLKENGLLSGERKPVHRPKPHSEITKLRFDPERSPVDGIPTDLRMPLFDILSQYADGAVHKQGRIWVDFDLKNDVSLQRPYAYERSPGATRGVTERIAGKRSHILGELSWPEALKRFREVDIALLPVGAIEQHGPHLPLDTDSFDALYFCEQVAESCSYPKPLVLPLIPYGVSYHHDDFSGTISVSNETLSRFVYEVGMSAAKHGITKLIIINGHGGNASSLQFAAQMINRDAHIFTCVDSGETSDTDIDEIVETRNDVHAGEIETSTSLALRPGLVDMSKARKFVPEFSSRYLNFSSKRSVEWNARTQKISKTGVLGDPTKASPEKGERIWRVMIRNMTEFVEQLKSLSLDEIYERKY